jgi:hypothetical protein
MLLIRWSEVEIFGDFWRMIGDMIGYLIFLQYK